MRYLTIALLFLAVTSLKAQPVASVYAYDHVDSRAAYLAGTPTHELGTRIVVEPIPDSVEVELYSPYVAEWRPVSGDVQLRDGRMVTSDVSVERHTTRVVVKNPVFSHIGDFVVPNTDQLRDARPSNHIALYRTPKVYYDGQEADVYTGRVQLVTTHIAPAIDNDELMAVLDSINVQRIALMTELSDKTALLQEKEDELKAAQDNHNAQMAALQEALSETQSELSRVNKERSDLAQELVGFRDRVEELEARVEAYLATARAILEGFTR